MGLRLPSSLVLIGFGVAASVAAQTTGNIEGRVIDAAGTPLPGVIVQSTSPHMQGSRRSTTAGNGGYRFPAVAPGSYEVRATLAGFHDATVNLTVSLDATATADLTLYPAAEAGISVSGEAPAIDLTSTTVGTTYTSKVIAQLPVSRNYADIVRANPAVEPDRGETQGRSLALAIYGATSAENVWIIDGVNTTNVSKGTQGKAINSEFVEEVEVKTGGYQAEYGRALGGIINVITKSGGNAFRGDVFGYYDSFRTSAERKLTSEDSLIQDMRIVDYRRIDAGADLGGYLIRDRLWFFAAYDRVDLPAEVSRFGDSLLVKATDRFPLRSRDDLYSGKLTWNVASGSSVVATGFADPSTNTGAAGADPRQEFANFRLSPVTNPDPATWSSTRSIGALDFGLRASHLFGSRGLMTLQASRHQDRYELTAAESVRTNDQTCPDGPPCVPPPGFSPNFVTGGYGFIWGPLNRGHSQRDQVRGDVNLFGAAHDVKIGGDYQDGKTVATSSYTGGQLVHRFDDIGRVYYKHDYFAVSGEDHTLVPDSTVRPRIKDYGAFIQDIWRAGEEWTINAGLRWDAEDIFDYRGKAVVRTRAEWQPRFGAVWNPDRAGKTKIYASAGRFYYSLPSNLVTLIYGNSTLVEAFNFDPVSIVQDPTVPNHPTPNVNGGAFGYRVDAGLKAIYQDEISAGVERLIGPGFSLGLKAVYRRLGNAIEDRCDLDYTRPETNFNGCGLMNPGSSGDLARGNVPGCNGLLDSPADYACSDTIPAVPPARRLYRGIELVARKAVAEKAWVQASYVYSSLRGNYDGEISEGFFGQTNPGINFDFDYPQLFHNSYGRLYLDRPHRFRLDAYYATPMGLSVGLQAFARSGAPLNKLGYLNYYYGPAVQLVPKGYAGRLPAEWEANLSVSYLVRVGAATATLQVYAYNLFNNQIPTSRDTVWSYDAPPDYPASIYDPNQAPSNGEYGKVTTRQEPRTLRAAVKISF